MSSVLFLCTGNYYRSRFAEEYFNHQANRHRLIWRAAFSEHLPMIQSQFPEFADRVEYLDIEDGHLEPVDSGLSRLAHHIDAMINTLGDVRR